MSYLDERRMRKEGLLPKLPTKKEPKPLKKVSDKKAAEIKDYKESGGDNEMDKYFDYHMKNSFPRCDNCGMEAKWLLEPQEDKEKAKMYLLMWRASQAHVLRKKDGIGGFPSIATNLTNHLVLFPRWGGYLCGCHDLYDSSYENMAKMAVFPKAIDIINQLYPFIKTEEKKYLPEIITQEIQPEIYNGK